MKIRNWTLVAATNLATALVTWVVASHVPATAADGPAAAEKAGATGKSDRRESVASAPAERTPERKRAPQGKPRPGMTPEIRAASIGGLVSDTGEVTDRIMEMYGVTEGELAEIRSIIFDHRQRMSASAMKRLGYDAVASSEQDGVEIYRLQAMDPAERERIFADLRAKLLPVAGRHLTGDFLKSATSPFSSLQGGSLEAVFRVQPGHVIRENPDGTVVREVDPVNRNTVSIHYHTATGDVSAHSIQPVEAEERRHGIVFDKPGG